MAPALDGHRPRKGRRNITEATVLTATVIRAADNWFELQVKQLPELAIQVASLEEAPHAVRDAAARATGKHPDEFDVQVQW